MTKLDLYRGVRLLPLVAPLVLSACVWKSDYDKLQQENMQLKSQVSSQQQTITADRAQIGRLQGAIKYTIDSDLLFPSGGYEVSANGKQLIARFAHKLADDMQTKILVVGYTDNAKIGPALMAAGITSNQVLSQKRADAVVQAALASGIKPDMISAKGAGESDPVASNDTSAGRAKNRRVELVPASGM